MLEKYKIGIKKFRGTRTKVYIILKRHFLFFYRPLKFTRRVKEKDGSFTNYKDRTLAFPSFQAATQEMLTMMDTGKEIQTKCVQYSQTLYIVRT